MRQSELDALYRAHAQTVIARLVRVAGGRVDLAEAAVHDAFVKAHELAEPPEQPGGWLYRVARNRLTDIARHEQVARRVEDTLEAPDAAAPPDAPLSSEWDDELLQMIFAVCQPALTADEQVALALRILCGLPRSSIAAIFVANEETIKKRLTSAKKKLRQLSLEAPVPAMAGDRLFAATRVLYAVFTEGHKPRSGEVALRLDLCGDAIRLGEVLLRKMPEKAPSLHALLALMKLVAARMPAREEGRVVLLEHQDRSKWDPRLIDAGLAHLAASAKGDAVTSFHHEATIAACHCLAPDFEGTDWKRIVSAYDAIRRERPSAALEVNRAIAVGFAEGFDRGIELLRALPPAEVDGYLPYHAALASLAERADDLETARAAYQVAADLSRVPVDRAFFEARLARLGDLDELPDLDGPTETE